MVIAVIVGMSGPMSGQVERHEDHGRTLLHTSRSPNVAVADASCGDGKAADTAAADSAAVSAWWRSVAHYRIYR